MMSLILKFRLPLAIFTAMIIAAGCGQQKSPEDKIYSILEKVVTAEKGFEDQQNPLTSLEKQEKELFDKIMGLGMKKNEEVSKLSDQALSLAEERKNHIEKEQKSIVASKKEFKKTDDVIDDLDDKELQASAVKLSNIMMDRYAAHDQLYHEYLNGIQQDEDLYRLLKKKSVSLDELEAQINKINKTYRGIFVINDKFNDLTEKYNKQKEFFYKKAGFKVKENS